jgi:hypothetical protein
MNRTAEAQSRVEKVIQSMPIDTHRRIVKHSIPDRSFPGEDERQLGKLAILLRESEFETFY